MANIGLTNIWFGVLTEASDGTPSYDGAKNLGKAVSCSVSVSNNDAKLYGDDAIAESDTTFASGSVTMGVTDDDDTVFAPLLGHTITDGEVIKKTDDNAPYVGIGRIVTKMVNGVYKYKVEFLPKVKFGEPSRDETTKGESIEFSTPSIEGVVAALKDGTWNKTKTFDSKSAALSYLQALLADGTTSFRVTFDLMGGESSTDLDENVLVGQSVTLPTTEVTAPTGKELLGWATIPTAIAPNVSSPYTPTSNITLFAVYGNEA